MAKFYLIKTEYDLIVWTWDQHDGDKYVELTKEELKCWVQKLYAQEPIEVPAILIPAPERLRQEADRLENEIKLANKLKEFMNENKSR